MASILFFADVVGSCGRKAVAQAMPILVAQHQPTFVLVNGENSAGGLGITPEIADELFALGADAITLGNHSFDKRQIFPYLDTVDQIVRPANYLSTQPGHGSCMVEKDGVKLGVLNLMGNVFLDPGRPMFLQAEAEIDKLIGRGAQHIFVDVHAEATSEKVGLGWHLDGEVSAVVGTHTHVPTADARVLPKGTAYMTDVGMCGPRDSVIGMKKEGAIRRMRSKMYTRLEPATEDPWVCAVLIELGNKLSATAITPIQWTP